MENNIKARRIAAGLTQMELAARCNVDRTAVSHWENDNNPKTAQLIRIADIFGCTIDELLRPEN